MVFYAKNNGNQQPKTERIFCFVELKDNIKDIDKATKQLINTYQSCKRFLKLDYIVVKACIVAAGGSTLQEHQKYQFELSKVFGTNMMILQNKSMKQNDFGDFLRGITKPKGKRKGKR
ncbi:hypothetical protein BGP_3515 [Beggiatoa sp. PS]|nr:hypothetical protein BGP_3515 [Beggiatoa sp. PS]